ncbi:MFS transporter [uncultured Thiocystis sp.]|jgi:PPP family 3-phenylpropionic acid transporter|uniref:MFS transporter n=1 Tax=uncultured Thiocystis sp. TaxID=1202134 RepID=UPI0025D1C330|nr:MFS transporter [uncultured Thiocystis sp.]
MPYWRLSAYYLCYFASLGALVPYWGLYLQSEGFDALAIGQLLAILSGTKIVAPMVWGHIVDRTGRRMPMVRLGALLSALAFVTVFFADGFWSMAAAMVLFSFFWNASLPQVEAVTFNHLRQRPTGYALVRLWGSVGFILVVAVLGLRLERDSLAIVPVWVLMLFLGVWLSSLTIPDSAPVHDDRPALSLRALLRRQEVLAFFAACFLMQLGHGIYYAFYSIHLEAAGYSSVAVGNLWALGVIAEVLVFLIMHRLLDRFGARRVLLWSLGLAILRWLLIGAFIEVLAVQAVAQLLHAATFGTFHASAIHLVHHAFPGRTQGRGQALYNSLSFGAGGAAGSLLGGLLWDSSGALVTFGVAAGAAAVGLSVAWRWAKL